MPQLLEMWAAGGSRTYSSQFELIFQEHQDGQINVNLRVVHLTHFRDLLMHRPRILYFFLVFDFLAESMNHSAQNKSASL